MAGDFIKLKVTGDKELRSRLQRINGQLITALRIGIQKALIELEGEIKSKISGKVLNVRTGTLRRSIGNKIFRRGDSIVGFVGSNVVYAAIHEFGGMAGRGRKVKIPERSYLRSTLREKETHVLDIVQREIKKLVEG